MVGTGMKMIELKKRREVLYLRNIHLPVVTVDRYIPSF